MTTNNKFPYEIKLVDEKTNQKLLQDFKGERTGFVQVGEKEYFFPYKFLQQAEKYYNVELQEDDIWVVSFPRSGTTITQELVWLIANDFDYKGAMQSVLEQRFPFFEFGMFFHDEVKQEILSANKDSDLNIQLVNELSKHGWEILPSMKSPRFIKSHLPFSLLPREWHTKRCKTIYVARNPKDVIVSFYHLNRLFKTQGYSGNLPDYWNYFKQNLQPWTPYWSHLEEALAMKDKPNVLFLFYEDIIADKTKSINKIAAFLGKTLNEHDIETLKNYVSIENFRKNNAVNAQVLNKLKVTLPCEQGFIRKGQINQNGDELTLEMKDELEEWMQENMKRINITFPETYWL